MINEMEKTTGSILRPWARNGNGVRTFSGWKRAFAVVLLCAATAAVSHAGCSVWWCFNDLADFVGPNGMYPEYMTLAQGADGYLYGTTQNGGSATAICTPACGTVFKIALGGTTVSTIYSFSSTDGAYPQGGLILGADGNFYGTTSAGGSHGKGTVFKITPAGALTTLHSFDGSDGNGPWGGLVLATDGNFYGTTNAGGGSGYGTVFGITPGGTLTTLHKFVFTDGAHPGPGLVQGSDGNFYGTTGQGPSSGVFACDCGTVFKLTAGGTLTTLHTFGGPHGANPLGALVQGTDGNFYGTTSFGGAFSGSSCVGGCGTVFKITPGGSLTTLHSFDWTDGNEPWGGLVQGTDGIFYGTTAGGGLGSGSGFGNGTVFAINSSGTLLTLHDLDFGYGSPDGSTPMGALFQATDGNFYGTTQTGPSSFTPWGTVFSLGVEGVGPFVSVQPGFGRPLSSVTILGTNLTGTTAVTFNGVSAGFTILSQYAIQVTVPAFATSGPVQVTTPGGTLTSNVPFTVLCPDFTCPIILPGPTR